MVYLTANPVDLVNISIPNAAIVALLGYSVVFFGLSLLMTVITILGKIFIAKDKKVAEKLQAAGYKQEDYTETKLLSPAAMDKAIGKKQAAELLGDLIYRTSGAPAIVPESDKRPPYDRLAEAQKDFN
jgi:Na+-transporting methylmalonyl-CoA/oxaloacetate decarboxylase gamma subunit